jgi:hypothetical protein
MGSLKRFDLGRMIKEYDTRFFFETGTWKGDGIAYASRFSFDSIYSSEIMPQFVEKAKLRFKNDPRVKIIEGDSLNVFSSTLPGINGNCIFWLDAHFPGADEGIKTFNEYEDEKIRLPLAEEIRLIKDLRKNFLDVFLVDDLRIYEEGPFKAGNLPGHVLPPRIRNTRFMEEAYGNSHIILKSYEEEGYLMAFPKEKYQRHLDEGQGFIQKIGRKLNKKIY